MEGDNPPGAQDQGVARLWVFATAVLLSFTWNLPNRVIIKGSPDSRVDFMSFKRDSSAWLAVRLGEPLGEDIPSKRWVLPSDMRNPLRYIQLFDLNDY